MQPRHNFSSSRIASAIAVTVALAASASSFASSDLASAAETAAQNDAALAVSSTYRNANGGGPLTREQVKEELRQARANGTLSMQGESGDTPQVLAARDAFNSTQSETIVAEVIADQQLVVALAEAEIRRSEIEAEGHLADTLALSEGEGETLMPEGAAAADGTEVQVDVIDMQTSAVPSSPDELVIVSLDGGDPATQRDRAMHVRRQLGAMGLAQSQIYIESASAPGEGEAVAAAEGDVEVAAVEADGS